MAELLKSYPGAQRVLFAQYHIGGCQSCGFQPNETLAQVCERNEQIPVEEAIAHIQASHQADASLQISPEDFETWRVGEAEPKILDVRTREEFEAVAIPGARLVTQDLIQEIFTSWDKATTLVIYDHEGTRCLDAAAYFIGHGFGNTKCLTGGIDAYSAKIDHSLPRYSIEMEA